MTALAVYGWASWMLSAEFKSVVNMGPDHYATWKFIALRIYEVISLVGMLLMIYFLLIKPAREGKGLTLYGMLFVGFFIAFFTDACINYNEYTFAWNTNAINMGVWLNWIPGHKFNHTFAESLIWCWPQYSYFSVGLAVVIAKGIEMLKKRRWNIVLAAFALFCVVFDIAWEQIMVRWELYSFTRVFSWFSLFPGTQFQHPLNNSISVALYPMLIAFLILSEQTGKNYIKRAFCNIPDKFRTCAVFFAVIGLGAASLLAFFHGPWAIISTMTDVNLGLKDLPSYLWYQ
jgi:hypothetical protein